jgi:hypothetical protein
MEHDKLALIELIIFFGIGFALVAWQYWSLRRDNRIAEEQKRRAAADAEPVAAVRSSDDASRGGAS